jgi:hypothetical protein
MTTSCKSFPFNADKSVANSSKSLIQKLLTPTNTLRLFGTCFPAVRVCSSVAVRVTEASTSDTTDAEVHGSYEEP